MGEEAETEASNGQRPVSLSVCLAFGVITSILAPTRAAPEASDSEGELNPRPGKEKS